MKNIDSEKLCAYLKNRFKVLGREYDLERENAKKAVLPDEINDILHRMTAINAKRSIIIELMGYMLGSKLDT